MQAGTVPQNNTGACTLRPVGTSPWGYPGLKCASYCVPRSQTKLIHKAGSNNGASLSSLLDCLVVSSGVRIG